MKNMRGAGKGKRRSEQTLSRKLKNICGMSVLLLRDVLHSCKNNVTLGDPETLAAHITRCHISLFETHAESLTCIYIFYGVCALKCEFKW